MSTNVRRVAGVCAAMLASLALASPSLALPPPSQANECDAWFPDFQCADWDGRYEGFVMPMQMPYLFEDPFITTGVNLVGIWHDFPGSSPMAGGEAWVLALQARLAITDRLAFIATKDGLVFYRPNNPALSSYEGFTDIAAGFKYALIDARERNFILTPSLRFDIPVGNRKVFSGNGDGVVIPGLSWAWGLGDLHLIGDIGGRIPFDGAKETSSVYWNFHADYAVLDFLVPFFEVGGIHYTSSAKGTLKVKVNGTKTPIAAIVGNGSLEAADVANLGSPNAKGNDLVIATFGLRVPINRHLSLGASYDFPATSRKDIFNQRATLMVTYEF